LTANANRIPAHEGMTEWEVPADQLTDTAGQMLKFFKKCTPSAHRYWLSLTAGILWLGVGITLVIMACYWLSMTVWPLNLLIAICSFGLGLLVYSYGFSRIAGKNIDRIAGQPEVVCLFAFQGWRSYSLIIIMMLLGYTIRHLPIPKYIDAVIYFTIGSALAFSSSLYFQEFSRG
jgi:hypothetical protein